MPRRSVQRTEARLQLIDGAQTDDFAELVRIAGLDPQRDLRFADWSGVDFRGADLRGFDLTGARLHGCNFSGGRRLPDAYADENGDQYVDESNRPYVTGVFYGSAVRIAGARFDQAELGIVEHIATPWRRENPNAPGVVSKLANLREAADWDEFVRGWRRAEDAPTSDAHLPVGAIFQDAPFAPEMVVLPAGTFIMGSGDGETPVQTLDGSRGDVLPEEGDRHELGGPPHEVAIPQPFAVGRFAVTFAEWDAAQADHDWQRVTGLEPRKPFDRRWGRGNRPVIEVSWDDAQAYVKWLSAKTGKTYRLLSEAEWEYAARAGTRGPFSFDGPLTTDKANYNGNFSYAGSPKGEYRERTIPVDSFQPNPWGLYQVHGNVWEWVEDCWNGSYSDKPDDLKASGAAWTTGDCDRRVLRGGSWDFDPSYLRSAGRIRSNRVYQDIDLGFRLARTLTP